MSKRWEKAEKRVFTLLVDKPIYVTGTNLALRWHMNAQQEILCSEKEYRNKLNGRISNGNKDKPLQIRPAHERAPSL